MELDLIDTHIDLVATKPKEIEETLEDPFALKFIPDSLEGANEPRYFLIGQTVEQRKLFICFNTDGKKAKIIAARDVSKEEAMFYDRNYLSFS